MELIALLMKEELFARKIEMSCGEENEENLMEYGEVFYMHRLFLICNFSSVFSWDNCKCMVLVSPPVAGAKLPLGTPPEGR